MSSPTDGARYTIYIHPAPEELEGLDNSLAIRIKNKIEEFQSAWDVTSIFNKSVTRDIDYIKKNRGDTRAFASYWDYKSLNVLLVLAVFKQSDKSQYWQKKTLYQTRVKKYHKELLEKAKNGVLADYIDNLRNNDNYLVVGPDE